MTNNLQSMSDHHVITIHDLENGYPPKMEINNTTFNDPKQSKWSRKQLQASPAAHGLDSSAAWDIEDCWQREN